MEPHDSSRPVDDSIVQLFRALADERRIKVAAAIIDHPRSLDEIAEAVGLSVAETAKHLGALRQAGLAEDREASGRKRFTFRRQPLLTALKGLSARVKQEPVLEGVAGEDQKVLSNYMENGRLLSIPAQQKKRQAVLRYLANRFEPKRMYGENEVNEIILTLHEDYASLRRYLVDENFLKRQIVRVVDRDALMEGEPQVEFRNVYWKPEEQDSDRQSETA